MAASSSQASGALVPSLAQEQDEQTAESVPKDGAAQPPIPPTDDEILQQQNTIRAEQADKAPYVGDIEELSALKAEYAAGSDIFVKKIERMRSSYSHLRRTRGDGNCFFRGFIFGFLESLLRDQDAAEISRFAACIGEWKAKMVSCGFQELVFEDAMELLLEQANAIGRQQSPMSQEALVVNFRDDMVSNMVVMFLRMLTSCEIQRRSDFFGAFLAGMYDDPAAASVDTFCGRFVEPMGEESDNIHIVAISDALRVPLRVVYLDRSGADNGQASEVDVTTHDFVPEGMPPDSAPRVHLLYRPGHYDVLYPMGSAASMLQSQTAQQQQMQQGQQQQQTQ